MKKSLVWVPLTTFLLATMAFSNSDHHKSKYMGQENRKIKSLSPDDIKELKKGGGWGLAKAAELNGYPGPSHILQMANKIDLQEKQKVQIQKLFDQMKVKSISLGNKLISLEKKLNNEFQNKTINQTKLDTYINDITDVRAQLRLTHLSTHLQTPKILTPQQVLLYNNLRGYSKDPCQNIPKNHDIAMWKKHNGCK